MGDAQSTAEIVQLLRDVPMFASCAKADLLELAGACETSTALAGDELVHEGSNDASRFFVIVSGQARVEKRYKKVAELGPGDFFGELALLVDRPRNCTVTAQSELHLLSLDRRAFEHSLEQYPSLAVNVARGLAERLSDLSDTLL